MTEISMLAARALAGVTGSAGAPAGVIGSAGALPGEKRASYVEQMGARAREMVATLDEIVWAMNPGHDTMASLVSYFCLYAERFLGLANITWKLQDASGSPEHVVNSHQRHQLFLAFKEALTNIVRHSGATEVRLAVQVVQDELRLSIFDNGRGLPDGSPAGDMDGVANMRARLGQLGGRFEITSQPGRGTTVRFAVPPPDGL